MTTSLRSTPPTAEKAAARAEADARALAEHSGVVVRELHTPDEMIAASRLLAEIWHVEENKSHLDPGLLVALAHADNYVAGAYHEGRLVAVCVGFFHPPSDHSVHSHIAGVADGFLGAGVGKALKHHQRAWCLRKGADSITWTFDPLVARNAYFNIHRLGTTATAYLPDFYGAMTDGINRGQPSDRMLLVWDLYGEPPADPAAEASSASERYALRSIDREPVLDLAGVADSASCRVQIPSDIERMRLESPELSARWRLAVRDALTTLMDDGWRVTDFTRAGDYCLERAV
ncbi:hypothetical protein ASD65_07035 [Microbacterium sp. Root61]|uniref:hypothetical protein n=1 Tax=Microbacterium sp. Root61 TaxID=1736570 RepID=UPI0006FEFEAD|nr:hypothetical protein [Microbacterium sp. Root61]KRA24200.1 hypothetical protein ASD65_07035 [Microbacterium sp. Root61]